VLSKRPTTKSLILEITTDGSIHPKEALKEAAKILIYHFMLFSDEKITIENQMQKVMKSLMRKFCTCVSC
jgi:DNA-directed RNA polymerase alpha subunit